MDAVGAGRDCHVDAIVHEEWCAIARADLAEPQRELEELARGEILLAQLQRYRPGRRNLARGRERFFAGRHEVAIFYDSAIGDQVQLEI
jgi:hypothetical protein